MSKVILVGLAAGTILWNNPPNPTRGRKSGTGDVHVTSVWTRLYGFSSQWPVKCIEVQEINPSNGAHILVVEPGPTGLAAVALAWTASHMDPIISPWSNGISESAGQQLPLLQPLLYGHTVFSHSYTILINMCVHRKLSKAILQARSVDREWVSEGVGGRWGVLLTTEVGRGPK